MAIEANCNIGNRDVVSNARLPDATTASLVNIDDQRNGLVNSGWVVLKPDESSWN